MRTLNRILVVALGYLAASAIGATGVWIGVNFGFGPNAHSGPTIDLTYSALEAVLMAIHLSIRAGLVVAPVALPIILFAEWRGVRRGLYFAVAGLILGLIIASLLVFPIFGDEARLFALIVVATPLVAAMTYWLIAWKLFPPKRASPVSI